MTTYWIRFRDWYLSRFRGAGRLGKLALLAAPLLFACCGVSFLSTLISPPDDPTPTAEVAERAATVESAAIEPTEEATDAPAATDQPTTTPRPTTRPTNTPRPTVAPTATNEPTRPPVRAATAVAATVAASQSTTAAQPTTAPPTSTRPPAPTATPTVAPPTAPPPTALPATAVPTSPPQPTAPPAASSSDVVISSIRYNGDINPQEPDEYAVITNRGAAAINLGGWRLNAGEPDQNFGFPSFDLPAGASCRVYTNQINADSCGGGTFGSGQAIWNNGGDCGALFDATGAEVSRFCW